jgi:hypothetical protein
MHKSNDTENCSDWAGMKSKPGFSAGIEKYLDLDFKQVYFYDEFFI